MIGIPLLLSFLKVHMIGIPGTEKCMLQYPVNACCTLLSHNVGYKSTSVINFLNKVDLWWATILTLMCNQLTINKQCLVFKSMTEYLCPWAARFHIHPPTTTLILLHTQKGIFSCPLSPRMIYSRVWCFLYLPLLSSDKYKPSSKTSMAPFTDVSSKACKKWEPLILGVGGTYNLYIS